MSIAYTQNSGSQSYCYTVRQRRQKPDWYGITIGDAFKRQVEPSFRITAQRMFYKHCRRVQRLAGRLAEAPGGGAFVPKTKPQVSPMYTTYPAALAAPAALGQTAVREFRAWVQGGALLEALKGYLEHADELDQVDVEPAIYKRMAKLVAERVQSRLLLEDLRRAQGLGAVEYYRLFMAAQQATSYPSVPAIVAAVVLFGDVLPDWRSVDLHPLTQSVLQAVWAASEEPLGQLATTRPQALVALGQRWTKAICRSLVAFLPLKGGPKPSPLRPGLTPDMLESLPKELRERMRQRFSEPSAESPTPDGKLAPLGDRRPPALFDPESTAASLAAAAAPQLREPGGPGSEGQAGEPGVNPTGPGREASKIVRELSEAVDRAAGQPQGWEDMRSDRVTLALRQAALGEGPMEGSATDGHVVEVSLGDREAHKGEIFERALPLSDDVAAYQALLADAAPVTQALRRNIYPSVAQVPELQRLCVAGGLDPGRLHLGGISEVVFRRFPVAERADERGRPVLLIACDASGSLSKEEMRMAKLLSAGWMLSTVGRRMHVLAALYHSGEVRQGQAAKLVQWMHHPRKTPALGRKDALRGLLSLPESGTGVQADAVSVTFLVNEAEQVARGATVFLILISDTRWNRCLGGRRDGRLEMLDCVRTLKQRLGDKLHITLVALQQSGLSGFDEVVDAVVPVSRQELKSPPDVAQRIASYVSGCMRERRRFQRRG